MPAQSDHTRRDAHHTARSENRILLGQFQRRLDAEAYAYIESELASLAGGGEVDGVQIGRDAAAFARGKYLADGDPREAIDAPPAALDPVEDA